jgi:CIC family chloride channel protein
MIDNFHNRGGKVRKRVPLVKAVSSIITISTGGSAGHEGPTAQIGSGLGSIVSRLFRVPEKMGRLLLLAGTASGLGAIFRAPLGGALTSVEVLYKEDFESEGFLPCIVASVVAYATFTQITGLTGSVFHIPNMQAASAVELFFFALLGVLCAPVSWLFVRSFYFSIDTFRSIPIPRHFKPALGGLGVGLIAYFCPQAVGGGWEYLGQAMHGQIAFHVLLWIVGFKIVTTCLTVGSGGSGGIFGPALFIGGMLGGAFGFSMQYIAPGIVQNPATYILVGMGAFFAGAANAPIASIIMVCEITGNYDLLAPLMLASVIHIMLSRNWSIYKNQKFNKFDSPVHKEELNTDILKSIPLSSAFTSDDSTQILHPEDSLNKVKSLMGDSEQDMFPVVDSNNMLVGLLGMGTIRKVILESSAQVLVIVEDMMTPSYYLRESMDLHTALQYFLRSHQKQLPVMPPEGEKQEILGLMTYEDIMQAYDKYL